MKFTTRLKPAHRLIDLTSLVDVIFLLLIFFIITSDILPLKSLHIESPKLTLDSAPLTTQILLVMDAQHVIYVGSYKAIVDLRSVKEKLIEEMDKIYKKHPRAEPVIVLSVDRRVDYGVFLQLLGEVQKCCSKIRLMYESVDIES